MPPATAVITGAFIPRCEWAAVLAGLKAPLGVHAILGNHDWWEDNGGAARGAWADPCAPRASEAVGIPVYENDVGSADEGGADRFWLAGLGDQLAYMSARTALPARSRAAGVDDLAATLEEGHR